MEEYPSPAEGIGLENRQGVKASRGFESLFLRHIKINKHRGVEQLVARRAHNPEAAGSSPVPATIKTADFVRNQRFLFTFYAVLHNEQESVYGFCSLFVLYPVRTVLHFIAGYPARSRRAGFIFALCLGERVCPGGTAARPWVNTVLCGFHS